MRAHSCGKSGSVLAGGADVVHLDAGHPQPDDRAGHRHPVVGVGAPDAGRAAAVAVITRPSGVSAQSPPRRLISVLSAASRSVSWPRRWAMPAAVTPIPGWPARPAPPPTVSARRRRAGRRRNRRSRPDPRTSRNESVWVTTAFSLPNTLRMSSAGCTLVAGQPVMRTASAADHGRRQERNGVRQVGFDLPVPGRDRAGAHPPAVGDGVVDVDAGLPQHHDRHRDVRRRRQRRTGVLHGQAVGERRRATAADRRRTATTPRRRWPRCRRRPIRCRAPGTADRRRRSRTPRPRSASSSGAMGRARACSSPSNSTAESASAASGGTKRNTVPARPQSTRASGPGRCGR